MHNYIILLARLRIAMKNVSAETETETERFPNMRLHIYHYSSPPG
jgi:hypothetical protein